MKMNNIIMSFVLVSLFVVNYGLSWDNQAITSSKMFRQTTKSLDRFNKLRQTRTKRMEEKKEEKTSMQKEINENDITIYVRRKNKGMWNKLKSVAGNFNIKDTQAFNNNEIDQFIARLDVDNIKSFNELSAKELSFYDELIAGLLFGEGFSGDLQTIVMVKSILPAFRKVKRREFEFGYGFNKYLNEDIRVINQEIYLPKKEKVKENLLDPIDLNDLITMDLLNYQTLSQEKNDINQYLSSIFPNYSAWIKSILNYLQNDKFEGLIICTDGSTVMSGKNILSGKSGLVLIPLVENHVNLVGKKEKPKIGPLQNLTPKQRFLRKKKIINSLQKQKNKINKENYLFENKENTANDLEVYLEVSPEDTFSLQVTEAETAATSALDAEIVAGLTALVVTTELLRLTIEKIRLENENIRKDGIVDKDIFDLLPNWSKNIQIHSDSRTFLKGMRTRIKGSLKDKSTENRLILWESSLDFLDYCNSMLAGNQELEITDEKNVDPGDYENTCLKLGWTAGHPEKYTKDFDCWTIAEKGSYWADKIASTTKSYTIKNTFKTQNKEILEEKSNEISCTLEELITLVVVNRPAFNDFSM